MRFKSINQLAAGDKVGSDLLDIRGRMIISKNAILTDKVIEKLRDQGFTGLYVDDDISYDIEVKPVIDPVLKNKAMACVQEGNIDSALKLAKEMVNSILENGIQAIDFKAFKNSDDYTFVHSVNVAILAAILGMVMKLPEEDVDDLMLAGLLHDLGKYQIPIDLLNKPGTLTKDEYELLKTHAQRSYELIQDRTDISEQTKKAVLLHHENIDGSGYPLGVIGEAIPMIAKILHVADTYDALISDRAYKKGYTPGEALEYIMGGCGIMFDADVIKAFAKKIPLYQKGMELVLSTGEHAIVVENMNEHNVRPIVRIVDSGRMMDLTDRSNSNITMSSGDTWINNQQQERERQRRIMLGKERKKHLLVVDDMRTNRMIIQSILGEAYILDMVDSGMAAVENIKNDSSYDLILMDIDMPEMTGLEAAREINNYTEEKIPILFVSSIRNKETILACRELHAAGYISRPYQPSYIKTEVKRIVDHEW